MTSTDHYDRLANQLRRPPSDRPDSVFDTRELVRLAVLAPSSHNTQPWKFRLKQDAISVVPDFSRRCPVVDPDDAHLYKSLGCATENLVQAASARGYTAIAEFDSERDEILIRLERSNANIEDGMVKAILERQCVKKEYDGRPLDAATLAKLERAGVGHGVWPIMLTAPDDKETVIEYVNRGDMKQLTDPAFRSELVSWIRFNPGEALRTRDGLSGRVAGQPSLPGWLASLIAGMILKAGAQADTDTRLIRSSAGVVVFVAERDDRSAWIEAGRACERFALQATILDVRTAFINQPIEVPELRSRLESWLNLDGAHALLVMRFGRGPTAPYSLRRPLEQVIVEE